MPRWNKPGVHGKTAEGRGRVVLLGKANSTQPMRSKVLGKSHGKQGILCFDVSYTLSHSYAYGEVKFGILTLYTWRSLCQEWAQGQ